MTAARRWWSVGIGVLVLVASPFLMRALPVDDDEDVSATELRDRVLASRDASFTAYGESVGNVALPDTDAVESLVKLVGDTNKVRVWWRDPKRWRVATLRATGETDLVHAEDRTVRWVYESKRATLIPDVRLGLPSTADTLPHELGRRVLTGSRAQELERLPARRVAGRDALGLRLTPADEQSGYGRVDVYADRTTGVPLLVETFARGSSTPAITTRYVDFDPGKPAASALRFRPPRDARLRFDRAVDLASAVDQFASRVPPPRLAGLESRGPLSGSVGLYGRGPTELYAIPLWERTSRRVREDLEDRLGVRRVEQGLLLEAPPLRLLLAEAESSGTSWLLAGTVTAQALEDGADELAEDRPGLRGNPRRPAPSPMVSDREESR